jgi:hypothetical protein
MGKARDLARVIVDSGGLIAAGNLGNAVPADGSITNAKIASVAASKLTGQVPDANAPSGSIIKVTQAYSNKTRQVFGNNQGNSISGQNFTFATGAAIPINFTKDLSSSLIVIQFTMSVGGSMQQHVGMLWNATAGVYRRFSFDGSRNGILSDSSDVVAGAYMFSGLSAGSQGFNWALGRSQDGNDVGYRLNPSNSDAPDKSGETTSEVIVYEIAA